MPPVRINSELKKQIKPIIRVIVRNWNKNKRKKLKTVKIKTNYINKNN